MCSALDLTNTTRALARLDTDEQALTSIQGISRGNDQINVVNESGLYSLVLGSRKPQAKGFKRWVTKEVLPAIRRTGSYIKGEETVQSPEELAALQSRPALLLWPPVAAAKANKLPAHAAGTGQEIEESSTTEG